jgi:hypothetical protein
MFLGLVHSSWNSTASGASDGVGVGMVWPTDIISRSSVSNFLASPNKDAENNNNNNNDKEGFISSSPV